MNDARRAGSAGSAWAVRLGPGPRLEGLQPLLGSLSGTVNGPTPVNVEALTDLDELVDTFPMAGRLILDGDHLLLEDIGFVRRFLSRNPDWSLVLVGADAARQTARTVLAFDRASWLAWPPDLDQLKGLVQNPDAVLWTPAAPGDRRAQPREPRLLREQASDLADAVQRLELAYAALRESNDLSGEEAEACTAELRRLRNFTLGLRGDSPGGASDEFDLGALLEEELTGLTVRGPNAPRYLFKSSGDLFVQNDPERLRAALREVLLLGRAASATGDVIRVQAMADADDAVSIDVDAPLGPLAGLSRREWLDPATLAQRLPEVHAETLKSAFALLRELGVRLEGGPSAAGRQRLRLSLGREANGATSPDGSPSAGSGTASVAESVA